MRLTARDRILLHLLETAPREDQVEVSPALTQEGLSRATGIEQRHLAQSLRPLRDEGLVRERIRHVVGRPQRMKVYDLTPSGRTYGIRLREKVRAEKVRVRERNGVREVSLDQALRGAGVGTSLLAAVRQVDQVGILDLETVGRPAESTTVEQLRDAPQVTRFLGRKEELRELTAPDRDARVFVIRGIPGIGKSLLAAKACEEFRGRRNLFWHRIRPWESGPTILADLGRFLEALDRPGLSSVLKRGDSGLAGEVLRQDLPDTDAFLVLDDAHDASPEGLVVIRMVAEAATSSPNVRLVILSRRTVPIYDARDTVLTGRVREIELDGLAPADAAALLSEGGDPTPLVDLGRRLGGHPLLLELARSHQSDLPRAVHDMRRFMEETIYRDLTEAERTVMKAASLFQVAVPQRTWLSIPHASYESLVGLRDRSLIRSVGCDRYEMHDTIRDFFANALTPAESRLLGAHVVKELAGLASDGRKSADFVSCVDYLSNALRLTTAPEERAPFLEALGEANARLGDLPSALATYAQALQETTDPETRARMHRLAGSLYCEQVEIEATTEAIDKGLAVLGDRESVERGWLDLLRGRVAALVGDSAGSQRCFTSALDAFLRLRCLRGEAEARLQLGASVVHAQRDLTAARTDLESALNLAASLNDPALAAEAHGWLGYIAAFGLGDVQEASRQLDAAEAAAAMNNPVLRLRFARLRGYLRGNLQADFEGARALFDESREWARKCHSERLIEEAEYGLALVEFYQGNWRQALEGIERVLAKRVGFPSAPRTSGGLWTIAVSALALGDVQKFEQTVHRFEHEIPQWKTEGGKAYSLVMRGLLRLVRGDPTAARKDFEAAMATPLDAYPVSLRDEVYAAPLFCSLVARVEGNEKEADKLLGRSRDILERQGRKATLALLPRMERDLLATFAKKGRRVSASPSASSA